MIIRRTFAILFALVLLPSAAVAQDTGKQKPGIVAVTGEGVSTVAPDMAVVTLSVVRQEKTARAALDANKSAMTEVLGSIRNAGVETRDIQTSNFSIEPQYVYPRSNDNKPAEPQIVGYRVSNTLTVRIRNLDDLGGILDQAVSLGVNQGGQILFTNDDPSAALTEARKAAVLDAIDKAKTLTEAAGVELGRISRIDEQHRAPAPVPLMRAEMAARSAADSAVPVAAGENQYKVQVNVSFELNQ